jgi:hypothetical protein
LIFFNQLYMFRAMFPPILRSNLTAEQFHLNRVTGLQLTGAL